MNDIENRYTQFRDKIALEYKGRRTTVVCGKVSTQLNDAIRSMIGKEYETLNDAVEAAVVELIARRKWNESGAEGE